MALFIAFYPYRKLKIKRSQQNNGHLKHLLQAYVYCINQRKSRLINDRVQRLAMTTCPGAG